MARTGWTSRRNSDKEYRNANPKGRYRKFAHPQDLERDTVTIRNLIPDFVALTGERFLATLGRV